MSQCKIVGMPKIVNMQNIYKAHARNPKNITPMQSLNPKPQNRLEFRGSGGTVSFGLTARDLFAC